MGFSLFTPLSWNDAPFILTGILNTVYISFVAIVMGTILGAVLGFVRAEVGDKTNFIIGTFVDILRSVPLIIQLILFTTYFGVIGYSINPFVAGSIVLSLYTMAFMSEVFRGGFQSVSNSMIIAAKSLGLTYFQIIKYIRVPIGIRTVFPSWLGVALSVIKDSALVSVIGYMEILRTSEQLISRTQQPLEILLGVGLFYFIISYPLSLYGKHVEKRMQV